MKKNYPACKEVNEIYKYNFDGAKYFNLSSTEKETSVHSFFVKNWCNKKNKLVIDLALKKHSFFVFYIKYVFNYRDHTCFFMH